MSRKTAYIIIALMLATIALEGFLYFRVLRYQKEPVPQAVDFTDVIGDDNDISNTIGSAADINSIKSLLIEEEKEVEIPPELNLDAAFYSQAPFENWDYPWQEACEEASVLLAANEYFDHNWSRGEFNDEILKLVDWENERFGRYEHTTVDETAEIAKDYLGMDFIIHDNPTYEDVQEALAKGHLIVMTFAGKKLGNPNYRNGGPIYHAMLIKGYKEGQKIITHDVGTKNGEDYVYSWSVISDALADYAVPIESGAKRMIELLPPVEYGF